MAAVLPPPAPGTGITERLWWVHPTLGLHEWEPGCAVACVPARHPPEPPDADEWPETGWDL